MAWARKTSRQRPMRAVWSMNGASRMSRSALSIRTESCAENISPGRSSFPRSKADSASATSCFGWDSNDQLYDNTTFTGWHTAYPDATCRILPSTCRAVPLEGDMLFFLGEFTGRAEEVCPRGTLRRVLQRAADMGLSVSSSAEFEFFVFEETPHSVREKNYRNLRNLTPGFFGYSLLRAGVHDDYLPRSARDAATRCACRSRGCIRKPAPECSRPRYDYSDALEAADRAALFKTFTKIFSQKRGLMATFMAKWSRDWPGQSGHLHVSLKDRSGRAVFHDPDKPHGISDAMRHFVGGQLTLMPELLAMIASTVNSYRRLIPGYWAPTVAAWGIENRTCALRAIPGHPNSQRIEYRIAAADINPYLALAAAIGSGLWGMENRIEPDAPIVGNAYDHTFPQKRQLPRSLGEAADRLKRSKAARALFGEPFVEHYAATREWEDRESRKAITDWELARYFEII